ncbi:MAG: LysE family transporter, partial [Pseudomonadota bacterium]
MIVAEIGVGALALLWLAWVVGGASPGPATLALAATGMSRGRGPATALAAGIVCGSAIWGVAAALGLAALMFANAWVMEALRYAGAAYILWLAAKSARSAMRAGPPGEGAAAPRAPRAAFLKGLALHLTNPKAIFSWGAVFAVAAPQGGAAGDLALIWAVLLTGSVLVFFGYARLFSTAGAMARYARLRRWFEGAFAILFGGAA